MGDTFPRRGNVRGRGFGPGRVAGPGRVGGWGCEDRLPCEPGMCLTRPSLAPGQCRTQFEQIQIRV
jgi:hypothetical protein